MKTSTINQEQCTHCKKICLYKKSLQTYESIIGYKLECWIKKSKRGITGLHKAFIDIIDADYEHIDIGIVWEHQYNPDLDMYDNLYILN